jgi:hypothetical protein
VLILGFNLPEYAVVTIGGSGAFISSRSSVSLSVITPAGPAGAANVTVADRGTRSVTMPGAFRYEGAAPPGAQPTSGPAPTQPAPGQPAPGQPAPTQPAPGQPAPTQTVPALPGTPAPTGAPAPTATPTPSGPVGTTYRPQPTFGTPTVRGGLRLAAVQGGNPLGGFGTSWAEHRCTTVVCRAVRVG